MIRYQIYTVFCAFVLLSANEEVNAATVEVVKEEKGKVTIAVYPDHGSKTNPVIWTYSGKLYGGNGVSSIREKNQGTKQSDPLIEFLKNMHSVIKNNKQDDYIKCWHSKEREGIKNAYKETPEVWERFSKMARDRDYRLTGIIQYGDYVIAQSIKILADGSVFYDKETLIKENGKYRITNDLGADQEMLWFSYIDGQRHVKDYKKGNR